MKYKYLFGPVVSRRIGISLGVDLIPEKYCSMNCIYCEIGVTSNLTSKRRQYIASNDIVNELNYYLSENPYLDYITFSGAGEPLLNSGIREVIEFLKTDYPHYKLALITNSSLLVRSEVRQEIAQIDLILPSLDAATQGIFKVINRPISSLKIQDIIKGLTLFRKESKAKMWLEVFIVPGLNDTEKELQLLKKNILEIEPDRVQLNSLDRPGTEGWVKKESQVKLDQIEDYFKPLDVEIVARKTNNIEQKNRKKIDSDNVREAEDITENILSTIRRRPCTAMELAVIFNKPLSQIMVFINKLVVAGIVITETRETGVFYKIRIKI